MIRIHRSHGNGNASIGFAPADSAPECDIRLPITSRQQLIRRIQQELEKRGYPRLQMMLLVALTACLALSLGCRTHARACLEMTESEIEGFNQYLE